MCIDPGHQARTDGRTEPLGPGSTQMMLSDGGGATGVVTRVPEYQVNLAISMNLKARLEKAGVVVVMTRVTNDVALTNAQRADIANAAHADLFLRIHADSSTDGSLAGISALYPADNQWTHSFAAASVNAARLIQQSVTAETGARDRGVVGRGDLIGFNWAQVPSVLVETGFQSNPTEDRLLTSSEYQDKIAEGIADGVVAYLQTIGR
ncbi:MAG: N-acetylmuramoyl-L-alanine amidase [Coriobacteriia bacterium]|nr:N-acetylmuramoyl-L-alanine amidase [Coriobacteriia bacterium]